MKKLFIAFLSLLPLLTFGQIIDELPKSENGKLYYSEVTQVDSVTQTQLYLNSKLFFVDAFKSAQDVIQIDDKEKGIIVGKAFVDISSKMLGTSYPVKMWVTIKIQSKDGRYKYEIYDFYYENYPPNYVLPDGSAKSQTAEDVFNRNNYYKNNGQPKKSSLNFKTQTVEKIELIKSMIIKSMNSKSTSSKDNW